MIRSGRDFWSGVLYVFFGATAVIVARDYSMGTALRMGPAYFPSILGGLLILIGATSIVRSFIAEGAPIGAFALRKGGLVIASVLLFGATVRGAGLAIALPALVLISAAASDRFRWWPSLILAAGLAVFCVFVFLNGLGVPLPLLGPWLGGD